MLAGFVPSSIAAKLNGRGFNNFDEFRNAFWQEVAADKDLSSQFSERDLSLMRKGYAPIADKEQRLGRQRSYILHHIMPIKQGGSVYDMNNIMIVTPLFHNSTLIPEFHYNLGGTNQASKNGAQ